MSFLANVNNTLSLLHRRSGLRLIAYYRMHHDFVWILLVVRIVSHTPIIANSIGKNLAVAIESCGRDGARSFGVPFQPVLRIFVPEVEGSIGPGSAEGAMYRVERDGVDRVDRCDIVGWRVAVAFEGEVGTEYIGEHWAHM